MRIAIDLDGTLIRGDYAFPLEEVPQSNKDTHPPREYLREGVIKLYNYIKNLGYEFWIYTFSFRTVEEIDNLFKKYNILVDGIINYSSHKKHIVHFDEDIRWLQKYPPLFDIDLLIDDLEEIKLDGDKHGFEVFLLSEHDLNWVEKVINRLNWLAKMSNNK